MERGLRKKIFLLQRKFLLLIGLFAIWWTTLWADIGLKDIQRAVCQINYSFLWSQRTKKLHISKKKLLRRKWHFLILVWEVVIFWFMPLMYLWRFTESVDTPTVKQLVKFFRITCLGWISTSAVLNWHILLLWWKHVVMTTASWQEELSHMYYQSERAILLAHSPIETLCQIRLKTRLVNTWQMFFAMRRKLVLSKMLKLLITKGSKRISELVLMRLLWILSCRCGRIKKCLSWLS